MEAGYTGLWRWTGGEPVAAISCSLLVGELFRSLPRALGSPDPRIAALATCGSPSLLSLLRTSHSVCLNHLPIAPRSHPRVHPCALRARLLRACVAREPYAARVRVLSFLSRRTLSFLSRARFPLGRLAPPTRRRGAPCPPCRSCSVWFARSPATPGCPLACPPEAHASGE